MKYKVLITRVEGFYVPDPKNPEINFFTVFVPRMKAKEEREYIESVVGTKNFTVSTRLKARFPLELDVMSAINSSIPEIADYFKENETELLAMQDEDGAMNDTEGTTESD